MNFKCFQQQKAKKEEKGRNLQQNLAKKPLFLSLHQNTGFIPRLNNTNVVSV